MKKQFALVFLVWLVLIFAGALPFYFSGYVPNITDAIFESCSGFTTTGASVITDIESLPAWLLFWRALTQWLGGLGIIILGFSFFPLFNSSGSRIHDIETSGFIRSRFVFRLTRNVRIVLLIYIALTILLCALLACFGMSFFDALCHSLSVMSTGGFSVKNSGIAYYNSAAIERVCTVFMFIAGINLSFIYLLFKKKGAIPFHNSELRAYTCIVILAGGIAAVSIINIYPSFETALRKAVFQVTSFISTTGLRGADAAVWPPLAQTVLFLLLFIGGCTGSAAGGVKVIRYVTLSKQTWNEMKRLIYPRGVFNIQMDGKRGNKKSVFGVAAFLFLYLAALFAASLLVSSTGADILTSINTALLCLGNIGNGFGVTENFYTAFPVYVKLCLCVVMFIGRFEIWTILVLFAKD